MMANHGVAEGEVPHEWPGIWNPAVAVFKRVEEEGSSYEGLVDPMTGLRNGYGRLTYRDGKLYEGQFVAGLKHGQGKLYARDSSVYDGAFENDLMHGPGTLIQGNGTKIKTTWLYGRKHGKGEVVHPNGTPYTCVFYHDMENLLERSSSRCYDCAWMNTVLSLITLGSLFPALYINPGVFAVTAIGYVLILIETCSSQTRKFLGNVLSVTVRPQSTFMYYFALVS